MSCQACEFLAGIGAFSGRSSARGAMFRSVFASRAGEGPRGESAQGLNRMEAGIVGDQACGIDRRPWPLLGAVLERANRDG